MRDSQRKAVLDVVEQAFDAPGAELGSRDLQRRAIVQHRMGAVQERSRRSFVPPEPVSERDDPGEPLGALAFLCRQPCATLESAIPPVWIQQDAAGLEDLDRRISAEAVRPGSGVGVAVMAAFPRDAFVPGRIVYLVSHRVRTEHGTWIRHARYGAIEPSLMRALVR